MQASSFGNYIAEEAFKNSFVQQSQEEAEYWDCTEKLLSTKKYNKLKNELKLKAHSDWPMLNLYDKALYFYHKLKDQNIELTKDHILKIGQYTH
jgi:hypothetical protein